MEQNEWILGELDRLFAEEKDFRRLALIKAAREIIGEQDKRIWQMEGELDGTLWSPKKWDE
ncbi:hypothetical protein JNUCC1_00202 [Lentibacillus sp. JNUCC-1]|uniref:hypothetical protein n=1 Tax=Lentibacillus sp. JNUCC-1 TaxID=2654513 RepID=UPI00132BAAE8|nr:hypothetical protein [Lentibacillus sp. JNUCC-1]MUV36400.1 hypothetical protein [Lentibacillus sp. JNUCC-1]